jgi:hypothetical protein
MNQWTSVKDAPPTGKPLLVACKVLASGNKYNFEAAILKDVDGDLAWFDMDGEELFAEPEYWMEIEEVPGD